MSSTQKLQSNTSIAYRRVQQIKQCTPSALPDQIDHDASHAFSRFCEWVSNGGVEFVPGVDSYKTVVKLHKRLPEYLRERLDSVFAGLARGADTGRHYEGWFNEIEEEWRERMLNASLMSCGSSKKQLQLSKIAALEMVPTFEAFFTDLRTRICGGGRSSRWRNGDSRRADWDFGYFGEKFSAWSRQ